MAAPATNIPRCDVWYATLPHEGGNTQSGPRPCIVVADLPGARSCLIIPLTSNPAAEKFGFVHRIEPTPHNGLKASSLALIFHVRHIDRRFLTSRAGLLSETDCEIISTLLADLLGFRS